MKNIIMYTDGACLGNPGSGGYGTILVYEGKIKELSGGFSITTNNRMEILAVIKGLEALKQPCNVVVYSDSKYVVDAINLKWLDSWKKKNWRKSNRELVQNPDLWKRLDALMQVHKVQFIWVKGHDGNPENERCDKLARAAAQRDNLGPDEMYLGLKSRFPKQGGIV